MGRGSDCYLLTYFYRQTHRCQSMGSLSLLVNKWGLRSPLGHCWSQTKCHSRASAWDGLHLAVETEEHACSQGGRGRTRAAFVCLDAGPRAPPVAGGQVHVTRFLFTRIVTLLLRYALWLSFSVNHAVVLLYTCKQKGAAKRCPTDRPKAVLQNVWCMGQEHTHTDCTTHSYLLTVSTALSTRTKKSGHLER